MQLLLLSFVELWTLVNFRRSARMMKSHVDANFDPSKSKSPVIYFMKDTKTAPSPLAELTRMSGTESVKYGRGRLLNRKNSKKTKKQKNRTPKNYSGHGCHRVGPHQFRLTMSEKDREPTHRPNGISASPLV